MGRGRGHDIECTSQSLHARPSTDAYAHQRHSYDALMAHDAVANERHARLSANQPLSNARSPSRSTLGTVVAAVTLILLALWLALVLAGAIAATTIFPTARETPLSLEGFETFVQADATQGRMLIAGVLVQSVFVFTAQARLWIALVAVSLIMVCARRKDCRRTDHLRLGASVIALIALLFGVFWAQPQFAVEETAYRNAARDGQLEVTRALKPAVDAAHSNASRLASVEVIALLVVLVTIGGTRRD